MNREDIARLLSDGEAPIFGGGALIDRVETIANAAAQAERHRIYAALEADPGALWRDQGFQEWRKNRQDSDER